MKKSKFNLLMLVSCLIIFFSCNKEDDFSSIETNNIAERNEILYFQNIEEFKSTIDLFNTFNKNEDYENWSIQKNFIPIYISNNESIEKENIPFIFSFILNSSKEFRIGNKRIKFEDGVFYEYDFNEDIDQKDNRKIFAKSEIKLVPQNEDISEHNRVSISSSGGSKKYWEEFNRNKYRTGCGVPYNKSLKYRLVQYLEVQTVSGPAFTQSDLYFKLRMSFRTSSWRHDNTQTERLYNINLSGDYFIKNKYNNIPLNNSSGSYSLNYQNSCYNPLKGTRAWHIAGYNFVTGSNLNNYKWDISLSGSVFHKVNGDTNEINTNLTWN